MLRAAVIAILIVLLPLHVRAEARIALLIGNQAYNPKVGPLKNPHDDIALVGAALRSLGFTVTEVTDADYRSMDVAIKRHAATVRREGPGAISLLYYSGHGAADPDTKTNYLIPVDVTEADDADLWNASLNLTNIVEGLRAQAPGATHYVIFDACRNELNLMRKGSKAITDKGFVPIAYTPGVMVAYATAPGKTAADIGSSGGPYAKALAEELIKPGVEAMTMFRRVALRVNREIGQDPWMSASTLPEVYFAGQLKAPTAWPGVQKTPLSEAAEAWDRTKDTMSIALLETFIARYKDTYYADLARARIEDIKKRQVAIDTPPVQPGPSKLKEPAAAITPARCDGVETQVGSEKRCLKPKDSFRDCPNCPEMVVAPAGRFIMGSPADEAGHSDKEGPQHEVTIGKSFAVGRFAVTRGEFASFVRSANHATGEKCWTYENWMGIPEGRSDRSFRNPGFTQDDHHPVVCVSWHDAKAFVAWLSKKTGKHYRLLSEAEREYVTRAGTTTPFWWGSSITPEQANYNGTYTYKGGGSKGEYRQRTVPVNSFEPNPWGLYNVHGNVWDWVEDCWHDNYQGAPRDGSAWTSGDCSIRLARGGAWLFDPESLRSAVRSGVDALADMPRANRGFRVARTLNP
jgi:formylglycine-generating enzyme required for sulfatase activity/uncharacterized caspase-like protein